MPTHSLSIMQRGNTPPLAYPLAHEDDNDDNTILSSCEEPRFVYNVDEEDEHSVEVLQWAGFSEVESARLETIIERLLHNIVAAHRQCDHHWASPSSSLAETTVEEGGRLRRLLARVKAVEQIIETDQGRWSDDVDLSMFPQFLAVQISRERTDQVCDCDASMSPVSSSTRCPLQSLELNGTQPVCFKMADRRGEGASRKRDRPMRTAAVTRCVAASRSVEGQFALLDALLVTFRT
jgi:hypothetical protein